MLAKRTFSGIDLMHIFLSELVVSCVSVGRAIAPMLVVPIDLDISQASLIRASASIPIVLIELNVLEISFNVLLPVVSHR